MIGKAFNLLAQVTIWAGKVYNNEQQSNNDSWITYRTRTL